MRVLRYPRPISRFIDKELSFATNVLVAPPAPAVLHEPQHMGRRPHVLHVPHHPSWRLVDKELSFAAHAQRILVAPRSGRTGLPLSSVLGGFPLQPLAICLERLESGRPFRHLAGSRFRLFGPCGGLGRHVPPGDQRVVPHETILLIPAFAACPVSCKNKIASGHRSCSLHHWTTTYRQQLEHHRTSPENT